MSKPPTVIDGDRAERAALRDITEQIASLKGDAARVLFQLGALLRRVEEEALWEAGGYASFTDYLERGVDVSRTTARRCIEVTRHFNLDVAERYGFDKLARGLRYLEATRRVERPGDLIAAELLIRGAGGRYETVSFHEATGRQIEAAIQLALTRRGALAHKPPKDVAAQVERIAKVLPPLPPGVREVKRRVEATETEDGEVLLTFRQIPLSRLRGFGLGVAGEGEEE